MINKRIYLSEDVSAPYFDTYILEKVLNRDLIRPFVLICPGGGYFFCNSRETESIALSFNAVGFNAAVLTYSTGEKDYYPKQLLELAKAVDLIKSHDKEWSLDANEIYITGFSAGGHLAASLGTLWNKEPLLKQYDCRPRGLILCYSVLVSGEFENKKTFDELCGEDKTLRKWNSLEDKVDNFTPSCFIWHTYEDALVPVENALIFASALRKQKVPFELHIFEKGPHSLSLCKPFTSDEDRKSVV